MSRSPARGLTRIAFLPFALALAIGIAFALRPRTPMRRSISSSLPTRGGVTSSPAALPPLAFVRSGDIWTCDADGSSQRRILRNGASPCWSPDHRQLAFARGGDIWLAAANGSKQRQLTAMREDRVRADETSIGWDPIENEVTFARPEEFHLAPVTGAEAGREADSAYVGSTIFAVSTNARRLRRPAVRFDAIDGARGFHFSGYDCPAWSRSGKHLAFAVNGDIWVATRGRLRFEGEADAAKYLREAGRWGKWEWEVSRLAARAEYDAPNYRADCEFHVVMRLSWSPDEHSLAYGIRREGGGGFDEVHLLRLGATDETPIGLKVLDDKLIADRGADPCFAPDGKSIVFQSYDMCDAGFETIGITIVSADGKARRRIAADAEQPAW